MSAALGLTLALTGPASAQSEWVPRILATGGFASFIEATDANDAGQVVGTVDAQAVLWTPAGEQIPLGTLGGASSALAINNAGQVVGFSTTASAPRRAFLWTAAGGMVELPIGATPTLWSAGVDINDTGQIVGYRNSNCTSEPPPASCTSEAFLWSASGGVVGLGNLGSPFARAAGINSQGHVVGTSRLPGGGLRAFLWTPTTGMLDLGTLGGATSEALGINDAGQVVGRSTTAVGQTRAFLWTLADGMIDLGTLAGDVFSAGADITNGGQIVGSSRNAGGLVRAFVWTPGVGMAQLPFPTVISGCSQLDGWATGASNGGYIAGVLSCLVNQFRSPVAVVWSSGGGPSRPREDLALDFGAHGTWLRTGTVWTQIHHLSALALIGARLDGGQMDDLVADFGPGVGVWALLNRTSWTFVHAASPSRMVAADWNNDGLDDIVAVFPGFGTWVWQASVFPPYARSWIQLHVVDASLLAAGQIDGADGKDLILELPGLGLQVSMNGEALTPLHAHDATSVVAADLDGNGQDDVVVDFAGAGIWAYVNNSTWIFLNEVNLVHLAAGDVDGNAQADLVADFGPAHGLWILRNGTTWEPLHGFSAESVLLADLDATGKDEIVVDFGPAYGLWVYANDSSWSQLHGLSPGAVAGGRFH